MKIIPTENWLLIKVEQKNKSKGGLFLPEDSDKPSALIVLECGPDATKTEVGAEILLDPRAPVLDLNDQEGFKKHFLVREGSVAATVVRDELDS